MEANIKKMDGKTGTMDHFEAVNGVLSLYGNWTIFEVESLQANLFRYLDEHAIKEINLTHVEKFDSAGAVILVKALRNQDMPTFKGLLC